jgi:hypothetical protein
LRSIRFAIFLDHIDLRVDETGLRVAPDQVIEFI